MTPIIFKKTAFATAILASLICFGFVAFDSSGSEVKLNRIAKEYKSYHQYKDNQIVVTDSSKYKWTIALCTQPKNIDMGWHYKRDSLFTSTADPTNSPHGNKLYRLFIKNYDDYRLPRKAQPIGQAVVKETWNVKEVVYDSTNETIAQIQNSNDGKWYTPTSVSELFVMYKEEESADNDNGWIYGIIDIENDKAKPLVLYQGKITTCMSCHTETKYDRIFGIQ